MIPFSRINPLPPNGASRRTVRHSPLAPSIADEKPRLWSLLFWIVVCAVAVSFLLLFSGESSHAATVGCTGSGGSNFSEGAGCWYRWKYTPSASATTTTTDSLYSNMNWGASTADNVYFAVFNDSSGVATARLWRSWPDSAVTTSSTAWYGVVCSGLSITSGNALWIASGSTGTYNHYTTSVSTDSALLQSHCTGYNSGQFTTPAPAGAGSNARQRGLYIVYTVASPQGGRRRVVMGMENAGAEGKAMYVQSWDGLERPIFLPRYKPAFEMSANEWRWSS